MSELTHSLAADGVLTVRIDMPGRTMNVFSAALMDALEAVLDRVDQDPSIAAVVVTSAKRSFLAGADLVMVRGFTDSARTLDAPQMMDLCGRLGRLFARLEASPKPWVAAVNGLALGGGLELAMACHARIVVDDPAVQLGLPEVRWGLLPGAGGTQRLPRFIGFDEGLSMLLTGRSMAPAEAVEAGLFDQALPAAELVPAAQALARTLAASPRGVPRKFRHADQHDVPRLPDGDAGALAARLAAAHGVSAADYADYPAYGAIIDSVLLGARLPLPEATTAEMRQFLRLMFNPVAGNMVRSLFLNRQRADRALAAPPEVKIERVEHGAWPAGDATWPEALARSRLAVSLNPALAAGQLLVIDGQGASHLVQAQVLASPSVDEDDPRACAVLSPLGAYGRVMEIVNAPPATAGVLAALAQRLGPALPYRSGDACSVLRRLAPGGRAHLPAKAMQALLLLDAGAAPDAASLDVAACAAGLTPAFTGGPLTYLWQHQQALQTSMDEAAQAAWQRCSARLAEVFG